MVGLLHLVDSLADHGDFLVDMMLLFMMSQLDIFVDGGTLNHFVVVLIFIDCLEARLEVELNVLVVVLTVSLTLPLRVKTISETFGLKFEVQRWVYVVPLFVLLLVLGLMLLFSLHEGSLTLLFAAISVLLSAFSLLSTALAAFFFAFLLVFGLFALLIESLLDALLPLFLFASLFV